MNVNFEINFEPKTDFDYETCGNSNSRNYFSNQEHI